ncbi:Axonemal 84 kDa protein, partial [Gryllus bimaculatus]
MVTPNTTNSKGLFRIGRLVSSAKAQDEIAAEQDKKMKEREQLIEEQKQFIEYEIQRNEEKIKSDTKQHEARIVQLHNSLNKFAALEDLMLDEELQARHLREWNLYIKEDRLPNPPIVPEMNTYLHKWHINFDSYEMKNIPERTDEVLSLLHILEEFIDYPLEANTRLRENWKE